MVLSYSLSLDSRLLRQEQMKEKYLGGDNQPVEKADLTEEEKFVKVMNIKRKEDVYGLGILIMEILLGGDFVMDYINNIYYDNGKQLDFVVTIPDELKKDEEITDIVEDCLLNVDCRPTISEILERLQRWASTETPKEQQVEYEPVN